MSTSTFGLYPRIYRSPGSKCIHVQTAPTRSIAEAVAASISIPVFFRPTELTGDLHLDGGLLSNFPAWIFLEKSLEAQLPILGFELVDIENRDIQHDPISFTSALISSVVSGKKRLEIRGIARLYSIQIPVTASTFKFDMCHQEKCITFNEGYQAVKGFFPRSPQLVPRAQMEPFLCLRLRTALGEPNPGSPSQS